MTWMLSSSTTSVLTSSRSLQHSFSLHPWQTSITTRPFVTNPFSKALRGLQLKRLEREASQDPSDAVAQYRFLAELAVDHPQAVVERFKHPAFRNQAMDTSMAILYLQVLQQLNQVNQLDTDELMQRLSKSNSIPAETLTDFRNEMAAQKLNKVEQAQAVLNFLMVGGGAGTAMAAGLGSIAASHRAKPFAGAALSGGVPTMFNNRGLDSKSPIFVQVTQPGGGARAAIIGFVTRATLLLIAFSAVGALLDERGLGRGIGMNASSKHVQEAEQEGRKVKFEDVKGVEEAKAELEEIVLYLKDPSRFTRLGGKLPRGVLLTGPPGTGKTLLAKAIAGEADVPFFYSSGSQFEEVYVGLGAKRIRELFEAAKKKSPAIVFIDEIDAVGGTRKLKDQSALKMTLNELLVQLDGFEENNGIIVIGATNFMESLDPALLRPGRFDKHVTVPLPDVGGRKEILEMYAKKTKLSTDVDLNVLARGTTGFSGADLFNLMNQAALKVCSLGVEEVYAVPSPYSDVAFHPSFVPGLHRRFKRDQHVCTGVCQGQDFDGSGTQDCRYHGGDRTLHGVPRSRSCRDCRFDRWCDAHPQSDNHAARECIRYGHYVTRRRSDIAIVERDVGVHGCRYGRSCGGRVDLWQRGGDFWCYE